MPQDRTQWPWWVRAGLAGLPARGWAVAGYWLCVLTACACIALGFIDPVCFAGGLFFLPACWYQQSIRWVDRTNGRSTADPEDTW